MKRKWVIWGVVVLVIVIVAAVLAARQRTQRTDKYLVDLASDDYEDAADAIAGLVSRGGNVVPRLLKRLSGRQDPRFRWRTAEVLGRIGDGRAVDPLIEALQDDDSGVREAAATALAKIGDPKAVQPLTEALEDEEPAVQIRAALGLADFPDPDATRVAALTQLFERSMPEAVAEAEAAKAELEGTAEEEEPAAGEAEEEEEGPPPDTRFEVREAIVRALGRMAADIPEEALPTVNAALDDPDPHETVRIAACEALGQLGRAESAPLLIPRLSDMSAGVATAAAWALAQIDDPSATEALERAAGPDRAYWVRQAATEALERRGIEAQ